MTTIRGSVLLGAALILGSFSSAQAADLYDGGFRGSMKDVPEVHDHARWYVRGDAAYAIHDDPIMVEESRFDLIETSIDNTWSLGLGVGRYFTHSLRGDLTYDYRFEMDVAGTNGDPLANFAGGERKFGLQSHVFLANMYYDFNREGRFNPYLGIGLGFTINETKDAILNDACGCTAQLEGDRETHVAAALMAGFSVAFGGGRGGSHGQASYKDEEVSTSRQMHLDVGYRFLYLGQAHTGDIIAGANVIDDPTVEDIHAHEIRVGFRYDIN